jgi:hypothetical protein
MCLTIMEIESGFHADAHSQADAWGLMQVLVPTAADMVARAQILLDAGRVPLDDQAQFRFTLSLWNPTSNGSCLADPALGSLCGVAYLDHLAVVFGPNLDKLAAAYHNGPGFLKKFLAEGKSIPADMPPKGKAYVEKARLVWLKYRNADGDAFDDDDDKVTPARGVPIATGNTKKAGTTT